MSLRPVAAAAIVAWSWTAAGEPPKPTGLAESVEKRLVQLDVAVDGDKDAIRALTASDFALYVGEHEVQGLILDRLCGDDVPSPTASAPPTEPDTKPPAPRAVRPRATFVFFFDQPHLTHAGRVLSRETTIDLINRLIVDGNRASIVANGRSVETVVPMTDDRQKLLAGLDRVRDDPRLWDSYADVEERRYQNAHSRVPVSPSPPPGDRPDWWCNGRVRVLVREEYMEAKRSTQRLGFVVDSLADSPAPKGIIYFGDTLRQRAGLHYLQVLCPGSQDAVSAEAVPSAGAEFDALTKEATGRNVHVFTIEAEGVLPYVSGPDTVRHRHAQDALVLMAAETGGEAFLGGASHEFIGKSIEARTSCALLLSFPPGDLPRDKAINVTLSVRVPNVKVRAQGRIVVPSPGAVERSRLTSAFIDPASSDDGSLRALLIPRGGDGKVWNASVQLRLLPTGLPDNSAEIGASVVRKEKVTDHFAASIATKSATRAMVLEKSFDIAPGPFSIVAVARDVKRGDIGSSRLSVDWPNPGKGLAAITPIAVLQAGPAAMSKDGAVTTSGFLARDVDEILDPSAAISLASVVCRSKSAKGTLLIERWIEGGSTYEFAPLTIGESDDPCVQAMDVVNAGHLQAGAVDYRVVARIGDEIAAQERRTLRVGQTP